MGRASREKKTREEFPHSKSAAPAPRPQPRVTLAGTAPPAWLNAVAIASLAVLTWVIYYPSLTGEFVFDDHNSIQQSLLVREIWPLTRFVTYSNRPLVDFTYALNYAQGEYDTWWFHATNVAIHIGTAAVLYLLALRTLRLPAFAERYAPWSQPIAWAAAAIFACHPLATETVAYVASRSEGLAGFFYLLTILMYAIAVSSERAPIRNAARVAVLAGTLLAVASKEIAATIPLALVLYDYIFIAEGDLRSLRSRAAAMAPAFVPLVLAAAYVAFRVFLSDRHFTPYGQSAGFEFEQFTPLQYASTQVGVLTHYLRMLVVPTGLTMDYDLALQRSPFAIAVLLPLAVLGALAFAAIRLRTTYPFFSFAVLFFFIVLAPTSSVMPLADLAVERRMYIPLAGFALLAAIAVWDLSKAIMGNRALVLLAIVTIAAIGTGSAMTRARAVQWGDHLLLYEDAVRKSPGSPRVRLNLGVIHLNAGRYEEAHDVLFEAKRLYDEGKSIHAFERIGAFIYYNLGAIQFIREEYDDALTYMTKAIEIGGQYVALRPRAYAVVAEVYKIKGDPAAAESAFQEALKYTRDHPEWLLPLAEAQLLQGKIDDARETLFKLKNTAPEWQESEQFKALLEQLRQQNRDRQLSK